MSLFNWIGHRLAHFLSKPRERFMCSPTCTPELLASTLRRGDVLLIDGSSRISVAIKYITQSSWSHAALVVQEAGNRKGAAPGDVRLIEADVNEGVREVTLEAHAKNHTRICRPVGLSDTDIDRVVALTERHVGDQYDLKNVFDLARYLIQAPPVPARWRRRLLGLGSGDPTKAICSTLIAQAFHSVCYPILPETACPDGPRGGDAELMYIRHYSLFAPRDFDISPYFRIVKPTIEDHFDPYQMTWAQLKPSARSLPT